MAVNWALGQSPDIGGMFQQGMALGRQRVRENFLMQMQREQLAQQQRTREAQQRVGARIGAGDLPGARTEAAQSGNLDLLTAVNRMTADQRAEAAAQAQTLAPVYHRLRQIPDVEQRRAELQRLAPALAARGIPADAITSYDPTDQNLDSDISLAMTLEQQMDQQRIDWQIIPQVGAFAVDSMGRPVTPGQPGGQPIPQAQPPTQAQVPPAATPTAAAGNGQSFRDPLYDQLEAQIGPELGVPPQVMAAIRTRGERSNADQVSSAGARSVYQFTPETRRLFMNRYGVDAWAGPEQAARAAALHLRESYERTGDWNRAVVEYIGGPDPRNHGPVTRAYAERVGDVSGMQTAQGAAPAMPGQAPRSLQDQAMTGVIQAPPRVPEGMIMNPDGSLVPRPGSQQQFERGRAAETDARAGRGEVESLLQSFEGLPQVRAFNETRQAMMQINRLANIVPQGDPGRAQHDMALIFAYMKALDPTSAVRETEYANASNAAGIPERIRTMYNRAIDGSILSPQQRNGMVSSAWQTYVSRAQIYNEIAGRYHPRLRNLGVENPLQFIPTARAPEVDRESRTRRSDTGETARAVQEAVGAMIPGQRQQPTIRVIRRRPAR